MKTLVVVGTRPEAIKLAPVALELNARIGSQAVVCSTGQHRDMVRPVFDLFGVTPDHDLDLMRPGQTLTYLAAAVTERLAEVIEAEAPDLVMVQGDTTTAFAAALSAFYCKVPVAHVEAGLRTGDPMSPWPEEMNRLLVGRLTELHFAPTEQACENLLAEGVPAGRITLTGNTVVDAALEAARRLGGARLAAIEARFGFLDPWKPMILFTMHRRESFGPVLERAFRALARFAATHDVQVLFPVHPNPNVKGPAEAILAGARNVFLVEPLEYDEMVHALQRCRFVVTDSGGLVEEAPTFRKPALVLRATTERQEAVDAGCAILCGADNAKLWRLASELLEGGPLFDRMSGVPNPFGDGHAAARVADTVLRWRGRLARAA